MRSGRQHAVGVSSAFVAVPRRVVEKRGGCGESLWKMLVGWVRTGTERCESRNQGNQAGGAPVKRQSV